jgi:hypothetical protein
MTAFLLLEYAAYLLGRLLEGDVKVAAPFAAVAVSKAGVDVKAPGTVVEVAKKPGERGTGLLLPDPVRHQVHLASVLTKPAHSVRARSDAHA